MPIIDPPPPAPSEADLPLHMWGWDTYSVQPWGDSWQRGYNSRTWLLRHDADLHVLKAVPHDRRAEFTSGLRAG